MSSTALVVRQLGEQAEINRTHGRLAVAILVFQDLAFVPFLALASALTKGDTFSLASTIISVVGGIIAWAQTPCASMWIAELVKKTITGHMRIPIRNATPGQR